MKRVLTIILICSVLLITTGCGCSRIGDKGSSFNKKDLSFDFKRMDSGSYDIGKAIEAGLKDAEPIAMSKGHFRIERNNYTYNYEEGNSKTKVIFTAFEIDARPEEKKSLVTFKGEITIDFESEVKGETYTITSVNHKVIEFDISNYGNCVYDAETGNFTIVIPEYKEKGKITQTGQKTTKTKSGSTDKEKPVTNIWDIDDTFENVAITFVPHVE